MTTMMMVPKTMMMMSVTMMMMMRLSCHATDSASGPATNPDNTWVLYPTLWCLSEVLEGARPGGGRLSSTP